MSKISLTGHASGSGNLTLSAPNTNTDRTLTMPDAAGELVLDTSTQTLTNKSIVATQLTGTIAAARLPAGSVLQVVSTTKTDTFSTTSTSFIEITGLSVSITPISSSSKILILANISISAGATYNGRWRVYRNGSVISGYLGNAAGNRVQSANSYRGFQDGQASYNVLSLANLNFLDSPNTTSAQTYAIYGNTNGTIYVNVTQNDPNDTDGARTASTITVMEIAA